MVDEKNRIRKLLEDAKREYTELGGWPAFESGEWLMRLVQRSFRNYWERATAEYFWEKYGSKDPDKVASKLISVAAKNSAILGALTGAAITTDELVALATAGEAGIGLPANLAIAATALSAEAILLVRFQLQLVANLGHIYGVPLDPDDPEDILTILAFALGGSVADAAGKAGMKIGGNAAGRAAKAVFSKELLAALKMLGAKIGIKILQKSIVQFVVPVVSIGIGTGWNYTATKAVGKIAVRHFKGQLPDLEDARGAAPSGRPAWDSGQ